MTRACALLALAAALLFAQPPAATQPKPASLTLTVVDSITQLPIKGATVSLNSISISGLLTEETNDSGEVQFPRVPPGVYYVSDIKAKGYTFDIVRSAPESINVKEGERRQLKSIAIDPPGSIAGTVLDEDGKPVAKVSVNPLDILVDTSKHFRLLGNATTDAEGRYKITGIVPGHFYVRVAWNSQSGIPTTYYPNGDSTTQAVRVEVLAGRETSRIDFRIHRVPTFHIRGHFEGPPKSFLQVQPCTADLADAIFGSKTAAIDSDGAFDAEVLPGAYCLQNRTYGPEAGKLQSFTRAVVRVTDRDVDDVRLTPQSPSVLTGAIKLEDGAGLTMPKTIALSPTDTIASLPRADVNPDGTFRLEEVFPVEYRIDAGTQGGYKKSIKLGGLEVPSSPLTIAQGSGPLTIEIAAAHGSAKGKVNLGSAKPRTVIIVLAPANSTEWPLVSVANRQGEFTYVAFPPGLYKLLAFADPDIGYMVNAEFLRLFQGQTVRISDTEVSNLEPRLIPRSEFEEAKSRF